MKIFKSRIANILMAFGLSSLALDAAKLAYTSYKLGGTLEETLIRVALCGVTLSCVIPYVIAVVNHKKDTTNGK